MHKNTRVSSAALQNPTSLHPGHNTLFLSTILNISLYLYVIHLHSLLFLHGLQKYSIQNLVFKNIPFNTDVRLHHLKAAQGSATVWLTEGFHTHHRDKDMRV